MAVARALAGPGRGQLRLLRGRTANMFGALVGGVLEYASLAFGFSSLSPLALGLCGLSWLTLALRGSWLRFEPGEA